MRTIADVIAATHRPGSPLPVPPYTPSIDPTGPRIAFMVASMAKHMTDEGYQLALALKAGGYFLSGHGFDGQNDVGKIIGRYSPSVVILQDKREWMGRTAGPGFDHRESFRSVSELARRPDVFKVGVLKDAHSDHLLHRESATEAGLHAWIIYYHPDLVAAQCPIVRREHLIRTYHSLDREIVPELQTDRAPLGLLSGALSGAYPLRSRLALDCRHGRMKYVDHWPHPGYGRNRCYTPNYLRELSGYKVAICTSSRFGYAVRKIIEATAAGCIVVTDLPSDEVLPEIDGNLVRIDSDSSPGTIDRLVGDLCESWDADRQQEWADRAKRFYDYRELGWKLAADIEALRGSYHG
jgi:hypothetical protein